MKTPIIITVCLFLSGCVSQSVNEWEVQMGKEICKQKENVEAVSYTADFTGTESVRCSNGQSYSITKDNLKN